MDAVQRSVRISTKSFRGTQRVHLVDHPRLRSVGKYSVKIDLCVNQLPQLLVGQATFITLQSVQKRPDGLYSYPHQFPQDRHQILRVSECARIPVYNRQLVADIKAGARWVDMARASPIPVASRGHRAFLADAELRLKYASYSEHAKKNEHKLKGTRNDRYIEREKKRSRTPNHFRTSS